MDIAPYLFFNGNAREALAHYCAVFDVPMPEVMTMAGAPPDLPIPADRRDWVMHATLALPGGGTLMMSDDFMANSPAMAGCSVQLNFPTAAEARPIFDALAEGGEVTMAWEPTFWSAGFGTCRDRFGIRWMVGCDEPPAG